MRRGKGLVLACADKGVTSLSWRLRNSGFNLSGSIVMERIRLLLLLVQM
jgi:hypothetical protein